ncbi:MAG: iron-sulfur cluster assembly accessory protein [Verrucomicrobiales bacterium]|jgi:iron-sulfur cluster assembly accessory protein
MLTITENAITQLQQLLDAKGASPEEQGLRFWIEKGGCAGSQYMMTVASAEPGDEVVEAGGLRFIIGAESIEQMRGSRIDYEDSLNDAGFKIDNPNAARSCGCGTSFEPAAAGAAG